MSTTTDNTGASERIVVGVDGSESSKAALAWAAQQAELTGATLAVVSTWKVPSVWWRTPGWPPGVDPAADTLAALNETVDEVLGLEPGVERTIVVVVEGHPAKVLTEESKTAALVVLGSRGRGEFAGMLLGSVSAFVATHSHCPVAVIRDHGSDDLEQ